MANYLTFSSAEPFTIAVNNGTKNWDGALEYSTDTASWTEWDGTTAIASAEHGGEQKIYTRGTGNTMITGSHNLSSKYNWVLTGANIKCTGNIENLLDYQTVASGGHPTMAAHCYNGMFKYCTSLITAPELPATTLAGLCYYWMFCGCTNLITPPALPATTLANECYAGMFQKCTNLIAPPALPATTLAKWCYSNMFSSCTNLTALPALSATTLTDYCYNLMFFGCSKIKIYSTPTDGCTTEYRIPASGTGTTATSALNLMFYQTGGLYDPQVDINTTYYTANEVIYPDIPADPSEPIDATSLFLGWLVGRQIAGMREKVPVAPDEPSGEPVAWLYNGVRLPGIDAVYTPEVQKTHPHAVIVPYGGAVGAEGTLYRLYLVDRPFTDTLNNTDAIPADADCIVYYAFDDKTVEIPDAFPMADRGKWEYEKSGALESSVSLDKAVWTNTDIYKYGFGAGISLAASEPIPVYE